jgi:pullulanase
MPDHCTKFTIIVLIIISITLEGTSAVIKSAKIQGFRQAEIVLGDSTPVVNLNLWQVDPPLHINQISQSETKVTLFMSEPFRLDQHYYVIDTEGQRIFLFPDGILDSLYSDKPLGYKLGAKTTTFRMFAPRARWVRLVVFQDYRDTHGNEYFMSRDKDGIWEFERSRNLAGRYYGYRVWGPTGEGEMFDSTVVIADPYSPATVTLNHYTHPAKTLIVSMDEAKQENDSWMHISPQDLIIYEMHVRDLTAHPSSGLPATKRGGYLSLMKTPQQGGLPYISALNVNAVELLPCQDFGNMEVPYRDSSAVVFNTWNPYARNHWGYMTSYFFAPESYYESGGTMQAGQYNGWDGRQVPEFKKMVKAFHDSGMAVLMDVVYNHVSQYDYNPFKYIDKFYYFRLNNDCSFTSVSGCGNDFKTERPMARRLIVESILYWMKNYHIDGFRFDLALLLDWKTIDLIRRETRRLNPDVVLIAEPWGGGYDPYGFSDHGWASWNDQFRNGVKGQNPHDGLGFIFGKWQNTNNYESLQRYLMGSLREFGGQYISSLHSVNYLASHDDYTLGDFIRIGLGDVKEDEVIANPDANTRLSTRQLRINKLAALFLLTSQGPVMIHEGQEYARSKVIAPTSVPDPDTGRIDHNSYNKDNETNWLNFDHARLNAELVNYYRGLIDLRRNHKAFRSSSPEDYEFFPVRDSLFVVFTIDHEITQYFVLLNGNPDVNREFDLPAGSWGILANQSQASSTPFKVITRGKISVPPTSGLILIKTENNR